MSSLAADLRLRCPELADFLEDVCAQRFNFEGAHPNEHSYYSHRHLWALEWWADRHAWIDLDYRVAFVDEIFTRWKGRLKGQPPYRASGFRMYLYEDLAPTVSVVAETGECPYDGALTFVPSTRDVLRRYVGRSWAGVFEGDPWRVPRERIVREVERHHGSIGQPTADALGIKVGELRVLIEQMGLDRQVNELRKRFKRRPANFRVDDGYREVEIAIFEARLPAGFRL
ncbi:MAG: hypothetical protein KDJ37_10500 [Hyphomicrobiaceae bacterium]|nr:hypothetical protein [Hyphomicrobiaceae bacterium]